MISSAIIVFREMLEISLVLGILLAATRGVANRGRWICAGIAAGLLGSALIAVFMEQISMAFEGMGQEIFNAIVLLVAAVLIGITVVWMHKHARELSAHLRQVGSDVTQGLRHSSVLATVVALTILRDGSEIVLLGHGLLAAQQSVATLLLGGLIGLVAGGLVGLALYVGLLRAASRHIFAVTSWLLIFLCAGMVSQAVKFLSAADVVPSLIYPLWDTSAILSERGIVGQSLHVMLGYSARPSGMQVLCYIATILVVGSALVLSRKDGWLRSRLFSGAVAAAGLAILLFATVRPAFAIDKIYSPIVEGGELELETRGTYGFDDESDKDDAYKQLFGIGYGFTDRFAAETYAEIEKEPEESTRFEALIAEARYQLFEQGEYWLDSGAYLEYEYKPRDGEHELEAKALLEKSTSDWIGTVNFVIAREIFGEGGEPWEGAVRWNALYRISQYAEPGIEWHSEVEDLDHMGDFDEQTHVVGPTIHGKLCDNWKYELAGLFAVSDEPSDFTVRWVLEYEL
ncbi:MAG: FTR1 family protein [Bdellovibrionales bacterium]|nr:FTR1 family protein [Bdellovibrionales bacterium]